MSFHVGQKEGVKDMYNNLGYTYKKAQEVAEFKKVCIERVEIREGYNEETDLTELYAVIAGRAVDINNQNAGNIWFYIPSVDNADILKASPEDLDLISEGNYSYNIVYKERKNPKKGVSPTYAVGTLEKE